MAFRIVVSDPKTGKSYMMESDKTAQLTGKRIGEKISGSAIGLSGYELQITGGSDITGNPMRADVAGPVSRKLLLTSSESWNSAFG
jgi:small subunit ribosomal protein S6e